MEVAQFSCTYPCRFCDGGCPKCSCRKHSGRYKVKVKSKPKIMFVQHMVSKVKPEQDFKS